MDTITFRKADYTWYDISILSNVDSVDIFLLFRKLDKGQELFNLITKSNPHPSLYCFQQPDKTHVLKLDFSSETQVEEYISVSSNLTLQTYPPLELLKQNKNFKIIIGTEQVMSGVNQIIGTHFSFIPREVLYYDQSEKYHLPEEQQN
jgi:hypothetical protein